MSSPLGVKFPTLVVWYGLTRVDTMDSIKYFPFTCDDARTTTVILDNSAE
jgi:hypothetical protein